VKPITYKDRLRYQFDNTMSKGPIALIGWLFVLSVILIVAISVFVLVTGTAPAADDGRRPGFIEIAWMGLMRTLDAGTMGDDRGGPLFLLAMLAITLGGVFVVSTLIGVLTSGIEGRLDEMRKGRSLVVEQNHTVILGWSSRVYLIVSELVLANANQGHSCIAILADEDKIEMEDEIRARVGSAGRTRIVCRTGNPMDLTDLEIVNPHSARSIIILPPEDGDHDPDLYTIKTILALTNNPNRRPEPYHIVAEIRNPKNMEVAQMVGRNEVQLLEASDFIARIMVQVCRQSGLSVVYTELLGYGGDEIYFHEEPALVGKTFAETLLAYEDSTIIGLRPADGRILLNPAMETRVAAGDQVIAIAEDDDTVRLSGRSSIAIDTAVIQKHLVREAKPERTLILGWNQRGTRIMNELDHYVPFGSTLTVVADHDRAEMEISRECQGICRQTVTFRCADTADRRTLEGLQVATYDHIILLAYSDSLDVQEADARTLITLLHLRRIGEQSDFPFSVISEMLDIRNRDLAGVTRVDDFIVSDKLISPILAQVSENKELTAVFADLFDTQGSELYLKRADDYVLTGQPVNFYTVVEAARQRGEIAIGYRLHAQAESAAAAYGIQINPKKSNLVTFSEGDRIIILAEE
jgi:ion channel POLLUX/CASTOR